MTLASYYEENPEAFSEAARRKDFQDQLLEGTALQQFVSSDPENPMQARAKEEVLRIVERAWLALERARLGIQSIATMVPR